MVHLFTSQNIYLLIFNYLFIVYFNFYLIIYLIIILQYNFINKYINCSEYMLKRHPVSPFIMSFILIVFNSYSPCNFIHIYIKNLLNTPRIKYPAPPSLFILIAYLILHYAFYFSLNFPIYFSIYFTFYFLFCFLFIFTFILFYFIWKNFNFCYLL